MHMIKLLSIQDRVSGWGQSFVFPPPPTPPYCALLITWVREVMCHSALQLQCERTWKPFSNFLPWPCPPVLLFGLLYPDLYWAEYFYVVTVVKVLFINLFSTQVTWFCLLQLKRLWAFPIAISTHMVSVS